MARERVSIREIEEYQLSKLPPHRRAELSTVYDSKYTPHLYKALQLPSYVHSYSLCIEYMKSWFLKQFPPEYFKTVYVNGRHVLDEWKHFNNYNIKREKPMLAVVPTVNYDWDREDLDMYLADKNILLKRSNYNQSFFKDWDRMRFIYLQMREMEMNFTFKVRVESRSQQLDLFNRMELYFKIGSIHHEFLSADFHIPYNIILDIADSAGFEINSKTNMIVDIPEFIQYMNKHSHIPIVFKMRAINQKPEFFVRARNMNLRISTRDKLQLDDGEKEGKLDTNYHIEMQCQVRMPIPWFYAYLSQDPIQESIPVSEIKPRKGIYTIYNMEIPPENEMGWPNIVVTSYSCDKDETYIDISELFANSEWPVRKMIDYSLSMDISPQGFLDVKLWRDSYVPKAINHHMDYNHMRIVFDEALDFNDMINIAIYADMAYVNDSIISLNNFNNTRINVDPDNTWNDPVLVNNETLDKTRKW